MLTPGQRAEVANIWTPRRAQPHINHMTEAHVYKQMERTKLYVWKQMCSALCHNLHRGTPDLCRAQGSPHTHTHTHRVMMLSRGLLVGHVGHPRVDTNVHRLHSHKCISEWKNLLSTGRLQPVLHPSLTLAFTRWRRTWRQELRSDLSSGRLHHSFS